MNELALVALFQAIVQMESGGDLKARNGDAYGPAQIKPAVVEDLKRAGYDVSLRERGTMDGSYRLFKLYTQHWVSRRKLKDTARTRATSGGTARSAPRPRTTNPPTTPRRRKS